VLSEIFMSLPRLDSRGECEASWRKRLEEARQAYSVAIAEFRLASKKLSESRRLTDASGSRLRQLIQTETHARQEYVRVLRIFTDYILNGTPPPES